MKPGFVVKCIQRLKFDIEQSRIIHPGPILRNTSFSNAVEMMSRRGVALLWTPGLIKAVDPVIIFGAYSPHAVIRPELWHNNDSCKRLARGGGVVGA